MTNGIAAREDFVDAMRKVPTVVSVITSYVDGRPWGLTVSAFCSVEADPPTVMVSLGRHTRTLADVSVVGRFGVSILSRRPSTYRHGGRTAAPTEIHRYAYCGVAFGLEH